MYYSSTAARHWLGNGCLNQGPIFYFLQGGGPESVVGGPDRVTKGISGNSCKMCVFVGGGGLRAALVSPGP